MLRNFAYRFTVIVALFGGASALTACSGGAGATPEVDGGTGDVDGGTPNDGWGTATNVQAVFAASCPGCHSEQWSSCWTVQACAATVKGAISSGAMPRGTPLSASDKSTVLTWFGEGAPCSGPKPDAGGACGVPLGASPVSSGDPHAPLPSL